MSVDLNDLIGKTVERIEMPYEAIVFTDGTVLQYDHDGCQGIYTKEEWEKL